MTTNDAPAAEGTDPSAESATPAPFDWGDEGDGGELKTEPEAEAAPAEGGEPAEEAAEVEADDGEPEKPASKLTPAQAALAKKEAALRAEQKAHQEAAEQLKKDRAELDKSKASAEQLKKAARTDLAQFVADLGLSPDALKEQVLAAWWSLQPEDKRPADFRKSAKTRSELDEIREKAEKADRELQEYKASVAKKEAEREQAAKLDEFFGVTREAFGKLALPHTNALAKARPAKLNKEIETAFLALVDEGVSEEEITPDRLGAAVEKALSERYGYLRDVYAPKNETTQEPKDKKAPTTALSAKKVAGGGPTTKAPLTERERFQAALKELGD
jgi:hypothetical protein